MEHTEVREVLELAAVEPAGLDRLAAGDTSEAAAVASHLAGCLSCTGEFERLQRTSALLRSVIATEPAPELRERTLAFVKAVGRDRPLMPSAIFADAGAASEPTGQRPGLGGRLRLGRPALWVASLAAAVIVSVVGTSLVLDKARNDQLGRETGELVQVVDWTAQVERAPDARQVALGSRDDPAAGKLVFSPGTRDLIVFTGVLSEPAAGKEYRCWLEVGGQRVRIGKMQFGAGLAYWFGQNVPALAQIDQASRFGISLVDPASGSSEDQTVLAAPL